MKNLIKGIFLFYLFIQLSGCLITETNTAVLWTNRPEVASYVEFFNSQQDKFRIELVYKSSPEKALRTENVKPDIIIGESLSSSSFISEFDSLERLFEDGSVDSNIFYQDLLKMGRHEGKQMLIPVSFNLPVLIFKQTDKEDEMNPLTISLEELREQSLIFNKNSKTRFKVTAFSPMWNTDFLYLIASLYGSDFHETPHGYLSWNNEKLKEALEYTQEWIKEVNGGVKAEQEFTEKYLYNPEYKLIDDNRIMFYFMDNKKYFSIPAEKRKNLIFRWAAGNNKIPVFENILYAGIPDQARKKKAALVFISWLFQPETQKALLKSSNFKRMRTFGIGQGFSSISLINELELPRYYPVLVGIIPPSDFLLFPRVLPEDWMLARDEIITQWLQEEIFETGQTKGLDQSLKEWLMQKPKL